VLRASVWLKALTTFRPDIAKAIKSAWGGHQKDAEFIRPDATMFEATPAESIDYAVMEKCVGPFDVRMVPLAAGWSDLGSWDSAWQSAAKDARQNASVGDAMIEDCQGVFVHASSRLVSVVGLTDVVVVETPDAVMVTSRARSQEVKKIVESLGDRLRVEHTHHRKVHRPWGWYDNVDEGPGFKVKRIMVKPGASLSLQQHAKRAEHWVVVSGTAEVTCGEKVIHLKANQSTYIPLGEIHRLANPGTVPLEIIEVQSGDYLGEDDIVRLEDHYGRVFQF
jgi:mannose-1-phosphate guanylyltransferase/mannose-6-phosphate isomerase